MPKAACACDVRQESLDGKENDDDELTHLKFCVGAPQAEPARERVATTRNRVLRDVEQSALRSVHRKRTSRVIEPRKHTNVGVGAVS